MEKDKIKFIKRLELAEGSRTVLVSDCCGAIVYFDTTTCPVCKKKFDAITEEQFEANNE